MSADSAKCTLLKHAVELVNATTGWNFTVESAYDQGRRVFHLMRVFNLVHGHTLDMEYPSARYASVPADGPAKGRDVMLHWDEMRLQYYDPERRNTTDLVEIAVNDRMLSYSGTLDAPIADGDRVMFIPSYGGG